jgi:hypothetical protein
MNGMILSYIGTTLTVEVDSVTLGEDSEICTQATQPCGTSGTVGYPQTQCTPSYTIGNTCTPCTEPTPVTYTSYSRNEFATTNQTFIIEDSPSGIFSPGTEIRAVDFIYPSWYINGTVIGYTGGNLNVNIESVQIGVGEITNELFSNTSFKFETGIKEFLVGNTTRITAFTRDTTVRITTPNMTIGTYMNGTVLSFVGNILRVNIVDVRTATGFSPYTLFVCDWCIQALVNNDRNSGNNWRISIRDPIGLSSNSRIPFDIGNKTLNITDGPTSTFTVARGIRISDKTYPTWYMDGIISGYTGMTGTNLIVDVNNTNNGTPTNIIYQLTSTSVNSFIIGTKTFVVPFSKTISAFTTGSSVKVRALNMPISTEMSGVVDSYIGTNLVITITTITNGTCATTYQGSVNSWHIEVLPLNTILSGSDWFVTLRNPSGARSNTRTQFSTGNKVFSIQDGPTSDFTVGAVIRVTDRTYPSWYMDGTVQTAYSGSNLALSITNVNNGSETTTIINKLTSASSFKFELGPKTFVVQDIKTLHLFTPPNRVTLTARNLWIGMNMKGTISSYIGDRLTITIDEVNTAAAFVLYTEFVNNWNIEAHGCDDDISGGDWVLALRPIPVIGTPTNVSAISGNTQATVSWTAPAIVTGIQRYKVTSSPGGISDFTTDASTSLVLTGLTNGVLYTFTVQALGNTNTILGQPSFPSTGVRLPLGVPTSVSAIAGDTNALVSWTRPSSFSGIVKYKVTSAPDGIVRFTPDTSTSLLFTGLTNNTAYTFTVQSVGSADTILGTASVPSPDAVTPISRVSNVVASSLSTPGGYQLSWIAPSSISSITSYRIDAYRLDFPDSVFSSVTTGNPDTFGQFNLGTIGQFFFKILAIVGGNALYSSIASNTITITI